MAATRGAVVCFGEALIDFLARPGVDGAPRSFIEYAGGAPANVAVGVARLGGDAHFVGMLGADMFGDTLFAQLRAHGVDTAQVRRTAAANTALAFVSLSSDGERSFSFYRPPAADLLFAPHDFDTAAFDAIAVFHVCSNSLTDDAIATTTRHGMTLARDAGAVVSMDLNLRPALWPAGVDPAPRLWEALAHAHLVKLSVEELEFLSGSGDEATAIARLFDGDTRAIVVTDGRAPMRWWTRNESGTQSPFMVAVIDTTAAGDAFVAGLLYGIADASIAVDALADAFADDDTRGDLLAFAAATGALATTRHGSFASMPSRVEVQALIDRGAH